MHMHSESHLNSAQPPSPPRLVSKSGIRQPNGVLSPESPVRTGLVVSPTGFNDRAWYHLTPNTTRQKPAKGPLERLAQSPHVIQRQIKHVVDGQVQWLPDRIFMWTLPMDAILPVELRPWAPTLGLERSHDYPYLHPSQLSTQVNEK